MTVADWPAIRLRFVLEVDPAIPRKLTGSSTLASFLPMEAIGEDGDLVLATERRVSDLVGGYTFVSNGDVLMAKVTPCFENGKGAIARSLTNGIGFATTEVYTLRPNSMLLNRYLDYLLRSRLFREYGVARLKGAGGLKRLSADDLRDFESRLPPKDEQRAIADYLDVETAKIDALIAKQQQLIETLQGRTMSVVTKAAWGGLDDVECGETGIDTAPKSPCHWRRMRNKYLLEERFELSVTGDEEMLSVSHLTGVTPRADKSVNMFEAESTIGYRRVSPGDLVINTMWAWMGALGVSRDEGIVSPAYGVYRFMRPGTEIDPAYFDYLYRTSAYVTEMTRHSRGIWSSRLRLYPESFLRLSAVVPPIDEQRRIADYLHEQTGQIDALIEKTERFIELSRERRAALITAAVTGQIDVRTAGAA